MPSKDLHVDHRPGLLPALPGGFLLQEQQAIGKEGMAGQRVVSSRLILIHTKGRVTSQERQQEEGGAGRRDKCCLLDIT